MYELRHMNSSDFCDIDRFWIPVYGAEFAISQDKLKQALFEDPELYQEGCFSCVDTSSQEFMGMIAVKIPRVMLLYPNTAWISSFFVAKKYQRQGIGTILYQAAEQALRKEGIKEISIGQEYRNFFSGIPSPFEGKEKFFSKMGFELNAQVHYDLEADIVHNHLIDDFDVSNFQNDFYAESLKMQDELHLYDFLKKEFPGRWEFEVKDYLRNLSNKSFVVILKDKELDKIKGFCMNHVNPDGCSGLGPIGIASDLRGRKIGDFILQQSLLQLRQAGADRVCIDWTILKDFYGKFGFEPARIFMSGYKEL